MTKEEILKMVVGEINLTEATKQKVKQRYESIVRFLTRPESRLSEYSLYVFPQGSFLYKTAIKPVGQKEEYDLDFCCCMQEGLSMDSISQEKLKGMLGDELKEYCRVNNFVLPIEEKKRCWQLRYHDGMHFHVDVLPCLPTVRDQWILKSAMYEERYEEGDLVESAASKKRWANAAILITDTTSTNYKLQSPPWHVSNPEGCAMWFRAKAAQERVTETVKAATTEVKDLSTTNNNSVLNSAVKLLKRHRDVMFIANHDKKPISIIISTLAAHTYRGESSLVDALLNMLPRMLSKLQDLNFVVCNPVTPEENFTDKWPKNPELKVAFVSWLIKAKSDFERVLVGELDAEKQKIIESILGCHFSSETNRLGSSSMLMSSSFPDVNITRPSRPWYK